MRKNIELSDVPIVDYTIKVKYVGRSRGIGVPLYRITCPEWRCEFVTDTPASSCAKVAAEIDDHNWQCANFNKPAPPPSEPDSTLQT